MRRLLLAVTTIAIVSKAFALDLAGFELGAELSDTDRGELTRNDKGYCNETMCRGPKQLGDYTAMVTVEANTAGRIQAVILTMPVEKRPELLKAAIEKFGKPAKTTVSSVQNLFGAQFSQVTASWKFKDGFVELVDRCGNIRESCIMAVSAGYISPNAAKKLKL